jgi:D-alanine-D-alanine ligase-like ATP-grasp enzyme
MGFLKLSDDISKATTTRSRVIWEEAKRRGIPMHQLVIFGKYTELYRAIVNGKEIYFESLPIPPKLITESQNWLDDKAILKEKLLSAKLPAGRGGAFVHWKDIRKAFKMLQKPVIIKPALGSRGRHTTTFIYTEDELKKAFKVGKQIADRLVMEEHLTGSVYRATIIDGKMVGNLRGDPPRITGDGKSTIKELIEQKNKNKRKEIKDVVVTPYIEEFLSRNGYTTLSVLPEGKTIDLIEKIGIGYGGYKAEEIEITHPEIIRIMEEAGRMINFPVMGFDFIIPDITKNPNEQHWGIIECNSLPFIDLHHFPLDGKPVNVAGHVWDLWGK